MQIYQSLFRNWWVIAVILMAWAIYIQALDKKNRLATALRMKVETLTAKKTAALEEKEELLLRIQSQGDPEWMELVLKEKLGVTAEGECKVVFQ